MDSGRYSACTGNRGWRNGGKSRSSVVLIDTTLDRRDKLSEQPGGALWILDSVIHESGVIYWNAVDIDDPPGGRRFLVEKLLSRWELIRLCVAPWTNFVLDRLVYNRSFKDINGVTKCNGIFSIAHPGQEIKTSIPLNLRTTGSIQQHLIWIGRELCSAHCCHPVTKH